MSSQATQTPKSNEPTVLQRFLAEVFGTWALTFFGPASVIIYKSLFNWTGFLFAVGAVFGFIVMILIYILGHISGTHINPSVTIGLLAVRRFSARLAGIYITAQIIGAIIAGLFLYAFYPILGKAVYFGSTLPGSGISPAEAVGIEAFLTMWLVFTIMGVAVDKRAPQGWAGFIIGMIVAVDIWVGGPLTGSSLNFARSLGPAIASAIAGEYLPLELIWVYLIGPILGGIIGAALYEYMFRPAR